LRTSENEITIRAEIEALRSMTVGRLRERYAEVFGEPSRSYNKQFLFRRVAWRIQALAEGGLSERARQRALEIANDADLRVRPPKDAIAYGGPPAADRATVIRVRHAADGRLPMPGSLLVRDYRGKQIVVTVLENGCRIRNLTAWPPLGLYLREVQFHPGKTRWGEGIDWILPPAHMDTFDDQTMTAPLVNLISEKIAKYRTRPMQTVCDELVLLVFFNQGVMYNTPIQTPRRNAQMIVDDVRMAIPEDHGLFSRAYLFLAPSPGERTFQLW
jgi:hypothetical protein